MTGSAWAADPSTASGNDPGNKAYYTGVDGDADGATPYSIDVGSIAAPSTAPARNASARPPRAGVTLLAWNTFADGTAIGGLFLVMLFLLLMDIIRVKPVLLLIILLVVLLLLILVLLVLMLLGSSFNQDLCWVIYLHCI